MHDRVAAMIGMLGPEDLTIVLVIAALLFGAKKVPELARSIGRAKNEFEKGLREGAPESSDEPSTTPGPQKPA
jgi:sec-independent protein translocase protein TatA